MNVRGASRARRGLFVRPFGTAGVPIAVVEGYVDFHAWSDDGRSIYFVRANRTIEVVDVNADGEPLVRRASWCPRRPSRG